MIHYTTAKSDLNLKQILELQKANLPYNLTVAEFNSQGFVTVSHTLDLLTEMNAKNPHIIAKYDDAVIGYALVMLESFKDRIAVLIPMFEQINTIKYKGKLMAEIDYFVMGQVCIAKEFRGQGIFKGLFEKMKSEMAKNFELVVTEVALRNPRSIKAHAKVGFKAVHEYQAEGEEWAIIAWDWN